MANIELPKDAEGREVPPDTKVLYSGSGDKFEVRWFTFATGPYGPGWSVKVYDPFDGDPSDDRGNTLPLDFMHLEKPDSLKQLVRDLNRVRAAHDEHGKDYMDTTCAYDNNRGKYCNDCRLHNQKAGETCFDVMMDDIISRANRLYIDSDRLGGDSE